MNTTPIIKKFANQTIAVIGDVMLDRYIFGSVERISPEAPIPIVMSRETMIIPGGAGNAANNIVALGAKCKLFGVRGDDSTGNELDTLLNARGIDTSGLATDKRATTEKTRVLGNQQQIVRIDREHNQELSPTIIQTLCQSLDSIIDSLSAIIVCDYAKGVINSSLMKFLRDRASTRNIPILADVRPEHKSLYRALTFITPNRKEAGIMVNQPVRNLAEAKRHGLALAKELKTNILLTMSESGMLIVEHQSERTYHLPTKAQEVIDVSGAGDTVIATMGLALAAGADSITAATIANHAASVVVAKLGTATVSQKELLRTFGS